MDLIIRKKKKKKKNQSINQSDLFLCGDVQVLEGGVKQQVLVDFVSCDVSSSTVNLRVSRQVNLQHLEETRGRETHL